MGVQQFAGRAGRNDAGEGVEVVGGDHRAGEGTRGRGDGHEAGGVVDGSHHRSDTTRGLDDVALTVVHEGQRGTFRDCHGPRHHPTEAELERVGEGCRCRRGGLLRAGEIDVVRVGVGHQHRIRRRRPPREVDCPGIVVDGAPGVRGHADVVQHTSPVVHDVGQRTGLRDDHRAGRDGRERDEPDETVPGRREGGKDLVRDRAGLPLVLEPHLRAEVTRVDHLDAREASYRCMKKVGEPVAERRHPSTVLIEAVLCLDLTDPQERVVSCDHLVFSF